jgi:hypothetical protein
MPRRPVIFAAALCLLTAAALHAQTVTWNPLDPPQAQPDTLFLPDLTDAKAINAGGGFLCGEREQTPQQAAAQFLFEPGRFGPAVRAQDEDPASKHDESKRDEYKFLLYPADGLIAPDEFTLQFWARREKAWDDGSGDGLMLGLEGNNSLRLGVWRGSLALSIHRYELARELGYNKEWQKGVEVVGIRDLAWHAYALTLKDRTLRLYVDARQVAQIDDVRFLPIWTSGTETLTHCLGLWVCGNPGYSSGFAVSDIHIMRTARVPGRPVVLRPLTGTVNLDAAVVTGRVPPQLVGSLHPVGSPAQTRAAFQVIRTDRLLTATPIVRGAPDAQHPAAGASGKFAYDWQVVDRTCAWFRDHGVAPYFCLDSTPSVLGGSVGAFSDPQLALGLSYQLDRATELPDNPEDWSVLVGDLVEHLRRTHAAEATRWSVWDQPSVSWSGSRGQYLDLYAATARAVVQADPTARVGGPEEVLGSWTKSLMDRCGHDHLPLHFVACQDDSGDLSELDRTRALVDVWAKKAGLPVPLPIVMGSFRWCAQAQGKSALPWWKEGRWHQRAFAAAYATAALIHATQLGGFETLVFTPPPGEDAEPDGQTDTSGVGPAGQPWAIYNALAGWRRTVGREVLAAPCDLPPGVYALATRDANSAGSPSHIGVVLANFAFAVRQPRHITITLSHMPAGAWQLKRYLIDAEHSSPCDAAILGQPPQKHTDLECVEQRDLTIAADGALTVPLDLPPGSSSFVILDRSQSAVR